MPQLAVIVAHDEDLAGEQLVQAREQDVNGSTPEPCVEQTARDQQVHVAALLDGQVGRSIQHFAANETQPSADALLIRQASRPLYDVRVRVDPDAHEGRVAAREIP